MEGYKYYKYLDSFDNDINYHRGSTEDIAKICADTRNAVAFNTVGFIKDTVCKNVGDLKVPHCFRNQDRGIYIKNELLNLDHKNKIRVKMLCNWCSSYTLCNEWKHMMSSPETLCHNNIEYTWEDTNVDLYVIINKPPNGIERYDPARSIVFHMEPWCYDITQNWGVKTWGQWARPNINSFLHVRTHDRYYNNAFWQLATTYTEFKRMPIIKTKVLSSICSSKYFDPGHIMRIDFLKYIESKNEIDLSIFNHDNNANFGDCYNGPHPPNFKDAGILPYKYYFMAENNDEYNFITEKIWESILCECVCFYWGCSNVLDYINKDAIIILDLNDIEASYNIVKKAIIEDEWSKRIEVIRQEKHKILDYYQFFATMERVIIHDLQLVKGMSTKNILFNKYFSKINKNFKKINNVLFYKNLPETQQEILDSLTFFNEGGILYNVDYILIICNEEYSAVKDPSGKIEDKSITFKNSLVNLFPSHYSKFFVVKCDITSNPRQFEEIINIYKTICSNDNIFVHDENIYDSGNYSPHIFGKSWLPLSTELGLVKNNNISTEIKILNLEHRTDRMKKMIAALEHAGFTDNDYRFVKATYGMDLDLSNFDINMFFGNDFGYRKAFIGCALSHIKMWQDLVQSDKDCYVIMEDDVTLVNDFKIKLSNVMSNIDRYTDIIYLGYTMHDLDLRVEYKKYKNKFNKVEVLPLKVSNYIGGMFGYIITKKGATTLLDYIRDNGVKHGIDYIPKVISGKLKMQECNPFIINTNWVKDKDSSVDSDIQKSYDAFHVDTPDSLIHSDDFNKVIEKILPYVIDNPVKNVCFLHSCYTDTLDVLNRLINLITNTKLLDKLDYVFVINIGNRITYDHEKIKIINYSSNITLFEKPTINLLCNFSKYMDSIDNECNILYLHTKGTHSKGQQIEDWKDLMLYFLVEKWEYCINYLKGYTSIGVNYLPNPSPHYSGNFWWSKTSYVKNKNLVLSDARHDCEWYILNKDCTGQLNMSLHNSGINHYHELYPRSLYDTEKVKNDMDNMLIKESNN